MKTSKRDEIILILYFLLQPLLDVCACLLPTYSIHLVVRGLFALWLIMKIWQLPERRLLLVLLLLICGGYVSYQTFFLKDALMESVSAVFKWGYLLLVLLYFSQLKMDTLTRWLKVVFFEYVGLYLCSYLFHFGFNIYLKTDGKEGFRGVFQSINELSAILVILYYYLLLSWRKKPLCMAVVSLLMIAVCLLSGTKVLFGFTLLIFFGVLGSLLREKWPHWTKQKKGGLLLAMAFVMVACILLFFQSNVYHNMVVQQDFFQVKHLFSLDFINRVLFNNRFTFFFRNMTYMKRQSILCWLFGIGASNPLKWIEIDFFDLFIRFGAFGLLWTCFLFFFFMKQSRFNKLQMLAFLILGIISFTSGHVLLSPAVSLYFGVVFACTDPRSPF